MQLNEALAARVAKWRGQNYPYDENPAMKNDLVEGKYVVEAAEGARVAVKVTDMLGEEVLSVCTVSVETVKIVGAMPE